MVITANTFCRDASNILSYATDTLRPGRNRVGNKVPSTHTLRCAVAKSRAGRPDGAHELRLCCSPDGDHRTNSHGVRHGRLVRSTSRTTRSFVLSIQMKTWSLLPERARSNGYGWRAAWPTAQACGHRGLWAVAWLRHPDASLGGGAGPARLRFEPLPRVNACDAPSETPACPGAAKLTTSVRETHHALCTTGQHVSGGHAH
jgi:hypothetical protein